VGIRSFLAFELSQGLMKELGKIYEHCKERLNGVRWVPLYNIHLTVVFLGDIREEDLEPLKESLAVVKHKYAPFKMKINKVGIFGSRRDPRVLWVGMEGDTRPMEYLRNYLEKILKPFGIKRENRPFKPHLTLGRFRMGFKDSVELERLLEEYREIKGEEEVFDELCLFKSQLTPTGSIYEKLHTWKLLGTKQEG